MLTTRQARLARREARFNVETLKLQKAGYPTRVLSASQLAQWSEQYNPHQFGDVRWFFWDTGLQVSQIQMARNPRRSRSARIYQIAMRVALTSALLNLGFTALRLLLS